MKKTVLVLAALAVLVYAPQAFATKGTCKDWKGLWEFKYDNATDDNATDNYTNDNGTAQVLINNVQTNYAAGPIMNTCMAVGKRLTDNQSILIMAPDNNTLKNYASYYPGIKPGSYLYIESIMNQSASSKKNAQILADNFTGDNFTASSNTYGLVSGVWKRAINCTDKDNDSYGTGAECLGTDCDDNNSSCHTGACCPDNETEDNCTEVLFAPRVIRSFFTFIDPIRIFVITAEKDTIEFARPIEIDFSVEGINDLLKLRLGKRIIFGIMFVNPLKIEAGEVEVTILSGAEEECATATFEIL